MIYNGFKVLPTTTPVVSTAPMAGSSLTPTPAASPIPTAPVAQDYKNDAASSSLTQSPNPQVPGSYSDVLHNYWKPNGVVDAHNAAAFRAWLDSNEKGVDIATFINSSEYAVERPKAAAALMSLSDVLRNYWKSNGVVNAQNAAVFQAWLYSNEGDVDIVTFINSAKYARERSKAIAALIR